MGAPAPSLARGHGGDQRGGCCNSGQANPPRQGWKAEGVKQTGASGDRAESVTPGATQDGATGGSRAAARRTEVPQHQLFITENFSSFFVF